MAKEIIHSFNGTIFRNKNKVLTAAHNSMHLKNNANKISLKQVSAL